jgi:D-aspartate ligase
MERGLAMLIRPPAVILGMSETGLATLRLLGRVGITCYGVDAIEPVPAFWSRYCRRGIRLPQDNTDEQVLAAVIELAQTLPPQPRPVLMPTSDRMVQLASRARARLEPLFAMMLPDETVVEDLLDKDRFAARAPACGATAPRSMPISGMRELPRAVEQLGLPLILKPFRQGDIAGTNFPKALLLRTAADVELARTRHLSCGSMKLVAQEYIPGPDMNQFSVAGCLDRDGNVISRFTARKRRQGTNGTGVGLYVERVDDSQAEAAGIELLQNLKCTGLAEVELKRHSENGRLYVIEINARVWLQVGLPAACGINFPELYYNLAAGLPVGPASANSKRAAWQDVCHDCWAAFRPGGYRAKGDITMTQWLKQSLRSHVGPFASLRDPMPAVAWMCHLAGKLAFWRRAFGGSSARASGSMIALSSPQ